MTEARQRRRQARGERRMAQILTAAAEVFAAVGYEAATTNAIAATAGISPGSLYQFFANKEAIAEALAVRFAEQMRDAHEQAFAPTEVTVPPLGQLLDRVIDPIVAFNLANPGLKALLAGGDLPPRLAAPVRPLQEAVGGRIERIIGSRAPQLPEAERSRLARVSLQIVKAMLPVVVAAEPGERTALIRELKTVLHRYLAPTLGD